MVDEFQLMFATFAQNISRVKELLRSSKDADALSRHLVYYMSDSTDIALHLLGLLTNEERILWLLGDTYEINNRQVFLAILDRWPLVCLNKEYGTVDFSPLLLAVIRDIHCEKRHYIEHLLHVFAERHINYTVNTESLSDAFKEELPITTNGLFFVLYHTKRYIKEIDEILKIIDLYMKFDWCAILRDVRVACIVIRSVVPPLYAQCYIKVRQHCRKADIQSLCLPSMIKEILSNVNLENLDQLRQQLKTLC